MNYTAVQAEPHTAVLVLNVTAVAGERNPQLLTHGGSQMVREMVEYVMLLPK